MWLLNAPWLFVCMKGKYSFWLLYRVPKSINLSRENCNFLCHIVLLPILFKLREVFRLDWWTKYQQNVPMFVTVAAWHDALDYWELVIKSSDKEILLHYCPGPWKITKEWTKNWQIFCRAQWAEADFNKILGTIYKIYPGLITMLQGVQKCIAWNPSK